ncbi:putative polyketide synthase protein [Deinococcus aerius]|uniref:Putative polyketide synthase protein n=1 Tax=Deinococcus aerius TaxID=200253 RepID=A0A2I9CSM2_9DEIO|nr:class I SAM-dependent methyltransferase [Deinococcus aerius]GBF04683.1 putative polyketide synthase protein [Deinococcus aerius]
MSGPGQLTPEQATLLIPLVAKASQNTWRDPILRDETAAQVLRRLGRAVPARPALRGDAFGLALRARALDEWTAAFLARHPAATVLHLGCGLDGRVDPVPVPPGARWFDLDLPEVIALRRTVYPRHEGPGYRMIAASVTEGGWLREVPQDGPVLVIAEGLLMYLPEPEVRALLTRLGEMFPGGELVCDALSGLGVRLGGWHPALRASGATLRWGLEDPREVETWPPGFHLLDDVSLLDLPGFARLPRVERAAWRVLRRVPLLRRVHRLLRYRFQPLG